MATHNVNQADLIDFSFYLDLALLPVEGRPAFLDKNVLRRLAALKEITFGNSGFKEEGGFSQ